MDEKMCVKVTRDGNEYWCTEPAQLESFIQAGWKKAEPAAASVAAEPVAEPEPATKKSK